MAGRGPAPKDADRKRRPKAEVRTELQSDATVLAPPLPNGNFGEPARNWYRTWCESPQAQRFTVTDWQRLHMVAPLVDLYWAEPKASLLAEIRLNESLLGATEADRARLRWDVKPAVTPVASPAERRERIRLA